MSLNRFRQFVVLGMATLLITLPMPQVFADPLDSEEPVEDAGPTPVDEFAPEDVRPARDTTYDEGLTINKVTIEGNKLIRDGQITESMTIRPGALYSKKNLREDLRRIYDMGYFTEKIKAVPISTSKGIHLRIEVQENAPVTGINIQGNTIIEDAELQQIFAGQTGLPQNIGQLNESIEKVEKLYSDKGYVLARVTAIADDPDGVINLEINEGVIDKVQFVGNRKTKDFVVKRAMVTKDGDIYNEKVLADDLKRIFGSQAFSDVRRVVTVSPENPDKYNLTVELDEKKTGALSVGGGVDTTTGFFGSVGYNDPNFLGRGQNFSSVVSAGSGILLRDEETQVSRRTYQFEVGWSDPSFMQTANSVNVNAYGRDFASFNVPLGVERRIGAEIGWGRPLLSTRNMSVGLSLKGENVNLREYADEEDLEDLDITADQRKEMMEGGTFVSLSPTLAYDTRDNRFDPTRGWFATFTTTGAMGLGGGSYGTAVANVRKYFKLREGVSLALNAQGGSSLLGDIPQFNMFRLGGSYNVRGFQEGGLGIGNGFMMGSAEVRSKLPLIGKLKDVPFLDRVNLAGFVDAGTLIGSADINDSLDRTGAGASIGAGVRVNIPGLGPIRIDYAIPIFGGGDYTRNFSFGVGQKF